MGSAFLSLLFLVGMPIVISITVGYLMMHITGRGEPKFRQTGDPSSIPLHSRYKGYSQKEAENYWIWLRARDAIDTEKRFLKADLLYPFFYTGSMIASLFLAWVWLDRPFNSLVFLIPVAIMVLADWTENLMQLRELHHFVRGESLNPTSIQTASIATITKCVFLVISFLMILGLAIWVVR